MPQMLPVDIANLEKLVRRQEQIIVSLTKRISFLERENKRIRSELTQLSMLKK